MPDEMSVTVSADGPYVVRGQVSLHRMSIESNAAGDSIGWHDDGALTAESTSTLCRCGRSTTKPFCDGSHVGAEFDGTETAPRSPYADQADAQVGPRVVLEDAPGLCAFARFCDVAGQIWTLVEVDDPVAAEITRQEAAYCPSGRLVVRERDTGTSLEPELAPAIAVVADPAQGVAGPLWVQGGIVIVGADGSPYERRNRVTLCRCGASRNKPFCDGSHAAIGFVDEQAPQRAS